MDVEIVLCFSTLKEKENFPPLAVVGAQGLGAACHTGWPSPCLRCHPSKQVALANSLISVFVPF